MSYRNLSSRLSRLEAAIGPPVCPVCQGVRPVTLHDEYEDGQGGFYHDPPLPEPCLGCGGTGSPIIISVIVVPSPAQTADTETHR
jgi:hypothetical protein